MDLGDRSVISHKESTRVKIYSLNVTRLPVNSVVLGCIHEIHDYEISLILPGSIRARLPITNISDPYSQCLEEYTKAPKTASCPKLKSIFVTGQLLPVKVLEKTESNSQFENSSFSFINVEVSINPRDLRSDLNPSTFIKNCKGLSISCAVKSMEEHGYLMDIGYDGLSGFLSFQDATPFMSTHHFTKLSIGQVVFCHASSCSARIVKLTTKPPKTLKDNPENEKLPKSCLLPGLTVSASITNVNERGLEVLIFSQFKGFVSKNHLKSVWDLPKKDYEIGAKIKGMILFVNPITRVIVLNLRLRHEMLNLHKIWSSVRVGQVIEDAQLIGKDEKDVFIFKLPNQIKGIAPKSELSDDYLSTEDLAVVENHMPVGSFHKCRVKSISLLDGYVKLTLKPSLLAIEDITIDNLKIGMKLEGTVKKLHKKGLVIRLGFAGKAFCPPIHFNDKSIANPKKYYTPGKKVKCRILRLDKTNLIPRIAVTCRPALLKKDLSIIEDINKVEVGFCSKGVVVLIQSTGVLVEFFNQTRGWISNKRLKRENIDFSESTFNIGEILTVYVVNVDKKVGQIHLSLQPPEENDEDDSKKEATTKMSSKSKSKKSSRHLTLPVGQILNNCRISRKDEEGLHLNLYGNASTSQTISLFLPTNHLSDFPGHTTSLSACYEVGDKIEPVVVFKVAKNRSIVSRKSLIINEIKKDPNAYSVETIHIGSILPAVVKAFKPYGIIMEMPGNLIGLVSVQLTSIPPIDPLNSPFVIGQTLLVHVKGIKEEEDGTKRLALSSLIKDCISEDHLPPQILLHFFEETRFITFNFEHQSSDPMIKALRTFKSGDILPFRVMDSRESYKLCYCYPSEFDFPISAMLPDDESCSAENQTVKIGYEGDGVVLAVDVVQKRLIISADKELAKKVKSAVKNKSYERVRPGQTILSFVHWIGRQFVLVALQAHGLGAFAYIPRYDHLNSLLLCRHQYKVGEKVYIVIDHVNSASGFTIITGHRSTTALMERKVKQKEKQKEKVEAKKRKLEELERPESPQNNEEIDEAFSDTDESMTEESRPKKNKIVNGDRPKKDVKTKHFKKLQASFGSLTKSALVEDEGFVWTSEILPPEVENENSDSINKDKSSNVQSKNIEANLAEIEKYLTKFPNDVGKWLDYINYFLEQSDIFKAKQVCNTALERIDHHIEDNVLKIWTTKLKIEIMHGSGEALQSMLKEALRCGDEYKILTNMVKIYESLDKTELAEQIYKDLIKRFHQDFHVWIDFAKFYLKNKMKELARALFQQALKVLDKSHHLDFITKFAQLECEFGDLERAKSLFEAVLVNFSKRTDLWSIYIDMMIKYGLKNNLHPSHNIDSIRLLFDRAVSLKLKPKKVAFLFQKYADFESKYGDERRIAEIKKKELDYAQAN